MAEYIKNRDPNLRRYLQTRAFVDEIRLDITKGTRELVGTREEFKRRGISLESKVEVGAAKIQSEMFRGFGGVQKSIDDASKEANRIATEGFGSVVESVSNLQESMSAGLETVSIGVSELKESFDVFSARYELFAEKTLEVLSESNERLDALIKLTKNPEQVWAWEQYRIASDCIRRGLHEEALDHLHRAVNGYQGRTGHRLEPRFHFDLGRLYRSANMNLPFANKQKAKEHFLLAARYYGNDDRVWQALSTLEAAKSALDANESDVALKLCSESIQQHSECGPALFLRAQLHARRGEVDEALGDLKRAFLIDPDFGIAWENKPELFSIGDRVRMLLQEIIVERQIKLKEFVPDVSRAVAALEATKSVLEAASTRMRADNASVALGLLQRGKSDLELAATRPTLMTVLRALEQAPTLVASLTQAMQSARSEIASTIGALSGVDRAVQNDHYDDARRAAETESRNLSDSAGVFLFLFYGVTWLALMVRDWPAQGLSAFFTVLFTGIGNLFIALLISGVPAIVIIVWVWVRKTLRTGKLTREAQETDAIAQRARQKSIAALQSADAQLVSLLRR